MYPDHLGGRRRNTPGSEADDKDRKKKEKIAKRTAKQSQKYGGLNGGPQGGRGLQGPGSS
jgi:hypothetical protein